MNLKQNKAIYIFLFVLMNIPCLLAVWMVLTMGWADFLSSGFLAATIMMVIASLLVLLFVDKMVGLYDDHIVVTHMRFFKRRIEIKDIQCVRLGKRQVNGTSTFFLVVHTAHDDEESDLVVGKRTMFVDLNFTKPDREKIYSYFEGKGLLESRKRVKYQSNK